MSSLGVSYNVLWSYSSPSPNVFQIQVLSFIQLSVLFLFCFDPFSLCCPILDVWSSYLGEYSIYQGLQFLEKTVSPSLSSSQLLPSTSWLCRIMCQVPIHSMLGFGLAWLIQVLYICHPLPQASMLFQPLLSQGALGKVGRFYKLPLGPSILPSLHLGQLWLTVLVTSFPVNSTCQMKAEWCIDLAVTVLHYCVQLAGVSPF